MGYAIWVDVQGRAEGDLPQDISIMLRLKHELDALSEKLRVPKLTDFYNVRVTAHAGALVGPVLGSGPDAGSDSWNVHIWQWKG